MLNFDGYSLMSKMYGNVYRGYFLTNDVDDSDVMSDELCCDWFEDYFLSDLPSD